MSRRPYAPRLQVEPLEGRELPSMTFTVFNEGDTIVPKIANVKLFATPAESGKAVATLSKGDEMIFMGEEKDGFLKVESGSGSGGVKKVLVSK